MTDRLTAHGWSPAWQDRLETLAATLPDGLPAGAEPGRVLAEHRSHYDVVTAGGVQRAVTRGRTHRHADLASDLPAVGDWLVLEPDGSDQWVVVAVLPRTTCFTRKVAGDRADAQVVAANVDMAWVVTGLDQDLNIARLQRYLTLVRDSGALPLIVMTKLDLAEHAAAMVRDVEGALPGVPVVAISCKTDRGMHSLEPYLTPGRTMVLVGSSGVGKSTLVNHLAGKRVMATGRVRRGDGKGRHTTTHRELVALRSGLLLIDTPGMREVHLWGGEAALEQEFRDIAVLADACRFRDCGHDTEPGCAVQAAVEEGELAEPRLRAFLAFRAELRGLRDKLEVRRRERGRGRH